MKIISYRTRKELKFDFLRLLAKLNGYFKKRPIGSRLHIGCGKRKVQGFVNIDIVDSDYNIDLSRGKLPWPTGSIDVIVCQQVIEHLEVERELIGLLKEFSRVLTKGGRAFISCPDMAVVVSDYKNNGINLLNDRKSRLHDFSLNGMPTVHMINHLFHQGGEHKNLFDFELLEFLLIKSGFTSVERINEELFLDRIDCDFPVRGDSWISLYVEAIKK